MVPPKHATGKITICLAESFPTKKIVLQKVEQNSKTLLVVSVTAIYCSCALKKGPEWSNEKICSRSAFLHRPNHTGKREKQKDLQKNI